MPNSENIYDVFASFHCREKLFINKFILIIWQKKDDIFKLFIKAISIVNK